MRSYFNHTINSDYKSMKAYFIFVLVLTAAYIVYYVIVIAKDLHGNSDKKKSDEEEFDVSEFNAEESVSVVENAKGFNIGDNEYETHYVDEAQTVSENNSTDSENPKQNVVEALNNKVKANMEEAQVTFSNPYNSADLYKLMMEKGLANPKSNGDVTTKPLIDEL